MDDYNDKKLRNIIEAVLFISPKPLSVNELCKVIPEFEKDEIREALSRLTAEYEGKGVNLVAVAGGYRFFSNEEYSKYVREVLPGEAEPRLSRAALETLSIIAYKQPITRVSVEEIRGIASHGVISTLLERGLIEVKGRLEAVGKPKQYGTTRRFLAYFGLNSLDELPPIEDTTINDGEFAADTAAEEAPAGTPE